VEVKVWNHLMSRNAVVLPDCYAGPMFRPIDRLRGPSDASHQSAALGFGQVENGFGVA
jgi:hypothetical protein